MGAFSFNDQLRLIQTGSVLMCLMIVCSVRGLHAQLRERTVQCFPLRVPLKFTLIICLIFIHKKISQKYYMKINFVVCLEQSIFYLLKNLIRKTLVTFLYEVNSLLSICRPFISKCPIGKMIL